MASFSFLITNPEEFLQKLERDFLVYKENDLDSGNAITCALVAWHLTDWVWTERNGSQNQKQAKKNYQKRLTDKYDFFSMLDAVANGSKHMALRGASAKSTGLHGGSYGRSHGHSHDRSRLTVTMEENGTVLTFVLKLEEALNYWRNCIHNKVPLE